MLPTRLRDRTTMPRTSTRFLVTRCPGNSKAVVTFLGLMAMLAPLGKRGKKEITTETQRTQREDELTQSFSNFFLFSVLSVSLWLIAFSLGRKCRRQDLNLHCPKATSPSSWRVCQFRHSGVWGVFPTLRRQALANMPCFFS